MRYQTYVALAVVAALALTFMFLPDPAFATIVTAGMAVPAASLNPALLRLAPRAVLYARPRADVTDPKVLLAQLKQTFEEFKAANDDKLKAKVDDVVMTEKVDRINTQVGDLQAAMQKGLDDLTAKVAAGGTGSIVGDLPASSPEYIAAFKAHMRKGDVAASMSKGSDPDGGYLAPVEWDRTITGKLKEISPIRANARVQTISGNSFKKMFTDRAVGSGWVGETAARPATSTPQLAQLQFDTGEIYAFPFATQTILDDAAVNLEQWLGSEVETEFARQEGIAFVSGDGANKPFGILTYVTGAANAAKHPWGAIAAVNTGAAAAFTSDGFIDLFYAIPAAYRAGAKLYTNRLSQAAMRKLKDGQGNYLWQPSYVAGQPATLGGESIVEISDFPNVAAGNIVALYGNMNETYLVIDRIGIRVLRDPFTNKPFVGFYTTKRVGGGVFNPEPMRALKVSA